jgi:hypothetical protein
MKKLDKTNITDNVHRVNDFKSTLIYLALVRINVKVTARVLSAMNP